MKYPTLASAGFRVYSDRVRKKSVSGFFGADGSGSGGYEGAQAGRRLGGWAPAATGPNAANYGTLSTMRARARDAIRNNPWAYSALETWATNLVGRGIRPRWKIPDETLRAEIQQAWDDWTQESDADGLCDFYGQQALLAKTIVHSGECIPRLRPRRIADGLSVPLQIQLLEPDFLDEWKDGPGPNGSSYHMGVQLDSIGKRAGYWLRKQHPGDSYWMPGSLESFFVPAENVLHCYRVDRPGQMRGVSWYSVVLARMFIFDQYEDAELDRKKTAALFAGFIKRTGEPTGPGGLIGFDGDVNVDDRNRPFAELEPGMLNYLEEGEDITFSQPADVGGSYESWVRMQLRGIAAGLGITYEQLTGDMTGINFSAARARIIEFRRQASQLITSMINFQFNQPVARRFLEYAVASGRLVLPDFNEKPHQYLRIDWRPDAWAWVQPKEDLLTEVGKIRAGLKTREDVITELGGDVTEVDKRNAELNKQVDNLALVYDSDARKVSNAGLTQARAPGSTLPATGAPDEEVESDAAGDSADAAEQETAGGRR